MIYRHKCYEKCHNQGNFWRKSKKITLENQGLEKSEKEKTKRPFIFAKGRFGFSRIKFGFLRLAFQREAPGLRVGKCTFIWVMVLF